MSVTLLNDRRRQVELAAPGSRAPAKPTRQVAACGPVEVIPRRWLVVRFPEGPAVEIPDDRVALVRLAIDRMDARQEAATC